MKKWKMLAAVCAVGLAMSSLPAAIAEAASASKDGYIECNPNRNVYVSSNTSVISAPAFYVSHHVVGVPSQTRYTSGWWQTKHLVPGAQWLVSVEGTLHSAGASCGT